MIDKGLEKLRTGDFNGMHQQEQPDGSVVITLSSRGEGKTYRFKVKDLYGKHEEVSEHEVIDTKPIFEEEQCQKKQQT